MNESGQAVGMLVRRHGVDDLHHVVIVHDELDLPVGSLRVKVGGGLAGHNGLKSIKSHLHSDDFVRVRIGVGKPPSAATGADYVLRRPSKAERADLDAIVARACGRRRNHSSRRTGCCNGCIQWCARERAAGATDRPRRRRRRIGLYRRTAGRDRGHPRAGSRDRFGGARRDVDRRPIVVAVPTSADAERLAHDLAIFVGEQHVDVFPAWETLPFERGESERRNDGQPVAHAVALARRRRALGQVVHRRAGTSAGAAARTRRR
jgi:hypothetical protein